MAAQSQRRRRAALILLVLGVLAAGLMPGASVADEPDGHETWHIYPSDLAPTDPDYGLVDADRLQAAIDLASAGDTIVMAAGTWVFDDLNVVDYEIHTARETFKHYSDWLLPQWDFIFATQDHHQDINIDKPHLTIKGERTRGETTPSTIITSSLEIDDNGMDYWDGYNGSFLVNAPYVTIRNLQFEKFVQPIWAYSPGFDIRDNRFIDCGIGHNLVPNVELTYPNWPNTNAAIASHYRNNELVNNAQPPHVVGSEVVVSGNHFDYYSFGMVIFPWGDYNDPDNFVRPEPFPINWDLGMNNKVTGNYFNCDGSTFGIGVWNVMSDLVGNRITRNTFEDCQVGVWIADYESSPDWNNTATTVSRNVFRDIAWFAINTFSHDDPQGVNGCRITKNVFENVGYQGWATGAAIWAETGTTNCHFRNNDYTSSGAPGFDEGQGAIFFDGWFEDGTYYGPTGNKVNERHFPTGTDLCDQFQDASMTPENPNGSNHVVHWKRLCK